MPVPEDERYWVVHVHNNNTTVEFKINNLQNKIYLKNLFNEAIKSYEG